MKNVGITSFYRSSLICIIFFCFLWILYFDSQAYVKLAIDELLVKF